MRRWHCGGSGALQACAAVTAVVGGFRLGRVRPFTNFIMVPTWQSRSYIAVLK